MGAFLVFDLSTRKTFEELDKWYEILSDSCNSEIVVSLIGNKCDLIEKRAVTYEEATEYAKKRNLNYIELSAKTGTNVAQAF